MRRTRLYLLTGITLLAIIITLTLKPIAQAASYHHFCDTRTLWGIPNFANTISNLPFVIIGIAGLGSVLKRSPTPTSIRASYCCLFIGIAFTGIGSAYYHLSPNNATLVFDRLPMTIVFMSLLAAVAGESIGPRTAAQTLAPLLLAGIASIWWWQHTGDLRPYVLVQYYPILLIPTILLLFPSIAGKRGWPPLIGAIAWYAVAKVFDQSDCAVFSLGGIISGHTLKHLAAAISTWLLVKRFRLIHGSSTP
jgi:ceramidase